MTQEITETNICGFTLLPNGGSSTNYKFESDNKIKNNLCKPMLKSLCNTNLKDKAFAYYTKCIDNDVNRNELKDINNIKYKYDKIKQQNIDNDLRKKSNELFNYLIIFFIVLFLIIIIAIIKFLKF
tara:strand:+ start:3969 stop:4346 length:378 start_codon:yes stop_codon:yes gene_type:complete